LEYSIIKAPAAPVAGSYRRMNMKYFNVEFDDVHGWDAPDFCDAFICYAEHEDGTPLTDEELEAIEPDQVYDLLMNHLY
jgi:hypothetical protein